MALLPKKAVAVGLCFDVAPFGGSWHLALVPDLNLANVLM